MFDEGNGARRYWQLYFPAIGWSATRRDRKEDIAPNYDQGKRANDAKIPNQVEFWG